MAIFCISSEIKRDIGGKSQFLYPRSEFDACVRGFTWDIAVRFGVEKLEWWIYHMVEKFEDTFTRFDTIHERDRHPARRTDRQTQHDGVGRAYALHRAAKNGPNSLAVGSPSRAVL